MHDYQFFFLGWYIITVVTGLRYDNGKSGILIDYGRWFDEIFGLNGCKWIPSKSQVAPYKMQIYYNCNKPLMNPLYNNQANTVTPGGINESQSTVVAGVGEHPPPIANGGKPVSSLQFINQMLTGSASGTPVDTSTYNKALFTKGTPYYNRETDGTDTTGYYYTLDGKKNEVPIFDPLPYNDNYNVPPALYDGTYGPNDNNTIVTGWNASFQGTSGVLMTAVPPTGLYIDPVSKMKKVTFVPSGGSDGKGGRLNTTGSTTWPIKNVPTSQITNTGGLDTMDFLANTQYLNLNTIYFKEFPVQTGLQGDPFGLTKSSKSTASTGKKSRTSRVGGTSLPK